MLDSVVVGHRSDYYSSSKSITAKKQKSHYNTSLYRVNERQNWSYIEYAH